jgi:hypothetical protein
LEDEGRRPDVTDLLEASKWHDSLGEPEACEDRRTQFLVADAPSQSYAIRR